MKERKNTRSWSNQIALLPLMLIAFVTGLFSFTAAANGFARSSNLKLQTWNRAAVEVRLNGRLIQSGNPVYIRNLEPGRYQLEVIQRQGNAYGNGGGRVNVLYNGQLRVPQGKNITARVERNRSLRILESRPIHHQPAGQAFCGTPAPQQWQNPYPYDQQDCHPAYQTTQCGNACPQGCSSQCNAALGNGPCTCGSTTTQHGYESDYGWDYVTPAPVVMNHYDYQELQRMLEDNFFDSQRLQIAKQAIGSQMITVEQVIGLMNCFSFESSRLDFAKFAYTSTIDPQRYYLVNESFHFSSSIASLNDYIAGI